MKNITLSAEEHLIESARAAARERQTSLNALFREWLSSLAETSDRTERISQLMKEVELFHSGGRFNRDEANER
ncbi:MAG: DUF6364 family protein [Verrucomicrobiota bacterium]